MFWTESYRGEKVVKIIENYDSIIEIASNYNLKSAITKTIYYGRRVEYFYEWFKTKYEE